MWSFVLAVFAISLLYIFYTWRCCLRNVAIAKGSGVPYVVTPVYTFSTPWLVTHRIWLPLLRRLPTAWTSEWIEFLEPEWTWMHRFEPFEKVGVGALIVVSPSKNTLFVADPEAIHQITSRRNDFPKPTEIYKSINLFGQNVVGTEGSVWRHHRKITSPPFTEKNNALVFLESLRQAQAMLSSWASPEEARPRTVHSIAADTMRLSLHVISRAGFGVRLLWPHEEEINGADGVRSSKIPDGHTMAYKDALSTLLHNIIWVMLVPHWLLAASPFKTQKVAYESFVEWGKYMNEIFQAKKAEVQAGRATEGLDLMDALVRGAGITEESLNNVDGKSNKDSVKGGNTLSDDEIIGNMFVFILAGHETAANTIHYSLLFLALYMQSQKRLQADLDRNGLSKLPVSEWDYDRDVPKLFGGMTGAVMNEELRLIPPVVSIPKCTKSAQPLIIDGRRVVVPADSQVNLVTVAAHRNPGAWNSAGPGNNLEEFRPERWLSKSATATQGSHSDKGESEEEDFGGSQGETTASTLLRPPRGAYIPFSDGPRACLGRKFAQVEVLAVLAVIFRDYSVELAVDQFASDEEVEKMAIGGEERRRVWQMAADRARHLMKYGMMTMITIQMRTGHVPLRFVKRGSERFLFE